MGGRNGNGDTLYHPMLLKYLRSSRCPFYSRARVRNIRENFAMTGNLLFRHFDILIFCEPD